MGPRLKGEILLKQDIPLSEKGKAPVVRRFGDRTKLSLWMFYSQGNKKQGHQLRVSRMGGGVRGLRIEEKILKKKFHREW